MPSLDGYMLAKLLILLQNNFSSAQKEKTAYQAAKANRACPIVAVTAFTHRSVNYLAQAAGILKVLQKPVSHQVLKATLDQFYDNKIQQRRSFYI
jgi:CheY-like chemotaxis protein